MRALTAWNGIEGESACSIFWRSLQVEAGLGVDVFGHAIGADDTVSAGSLGSVEGLVGGTDHRFGTAALFRTLAYAKAGGDCQCSDFEGSDG